MAKGTEFSKCAKCGKSLWGKRKFERNGKFYGVRCFMMIRDTIAPEGSTVDFGSAVPVEQVVAED